MTPCFERQHPFSLLYDLSARMAQISDRGRAGLLDGGRDEDARFSGLLLR
jgi:hypothetical protein